MVRTRQKMWVQFAALLLGSEKSEKWLYLLFYEIKTTTLNSFVTGKKWTWNPVRNSCQLHPRLSKAMEKSRIVGERMGSKV